MAVASLLLLAAGVVAESAAKLELDMVEIPAGTFTMGAPTDEPFRNADEIAHQVTITKPFLLGRTEITNAQYFAFVKATHTHQPHWIRPNGKFNVRTGTQHHYLELGAALAAPDHPVVGVEWKDVIAFANWLSQQHGLTACYTESNNVYRWNRNCTGFRLPTEAEWEYAARAGSQTAIANGGVNVKECEPDPNLDAMGWYCGNSGKATHPVAQKKPNAFGLYDMHGNVWEWVWDAYRPYTKDNATDPARNSPQRQRVLRGGAWDSGACRCRAAVREVRRSHDHFYYLGFRLARSLPKK